MNPSPIPSKSIKKEFMIAKVNVSAGLFNKSFKRLYLTNTNTAP